MATEDGPPAIQPIAGKDAEFHFASGAAATKPQHMVYLDFLQFDPHSERRVAPSVARIVMLPTVAQTVIDQLSKAVGDDTDADAES